jgi:hypothetical protein
MRSASSTAKIIFELKVLPILAVSRQVWILDVAERVARRVKVTERESSLRCKTAKVMKKKMRTWRILS